MFSKILLFSLLTGFVYAQGLSSSCTSTLASLATNPEASCLNPAALIPLFVGSQNASVVGPIDTWVTGLCATGPCSNETLANIVTNVTAGCSTELNTFGLGPDRTEGLITGIQAYYPTARRIVCLQDGDTNCVTQTLTNVEQYTGPLTVNETVNLITGSSGVRIPSNVTCTDCMKAAYNIFREDVPLLGNEIEYGLQEQCGSSFTNGTTPGGITETASSTTSPSDSGSLAGSQLSSFALLFSMVFLVVASL
ncbi:hypothetical protein AX16_010593 [Volvariella volvacea WC 439]|nr:hypothetical protein AX16_010593 [Volvariella volvacea WC 439]